MKATRDNDMNFMSRLKLTLQVIGILLIVGTTLAVVAMGETYPGTVWYGAAASVAWGYGVAAMFAFVCWLFTGEQA